MIFIIATRNCQCDGRTELYWFCNFVLGHREVNGQFVRLAKLELLLSLFTAGFRPVQMLEGNVFRFEILNKRENI